MGELSDWENELKSIMHHNVHFITLSSLSTLVIKETVCVVSGFTERDAWIHSVTVISQLLHITHGFESLQRIINIEINF